MENPVLRRWLWIAAQSETLSHEPLQKPPIHNNPDTCKQKFTILVECYKSDTFFHSHLRSLCHLTSSTYMDILVLGETLGESFCAARTMKGYKIQTRNEGGKNDQ